jgi:thioredoxin-like negative regulator of GroEL
MTPSGRSVSLRLSLEKPVLVHFWATWCEPCGEELPRLLEFGRAKQVALVLVSVDESWQVIRHFFGGDPPPEVVLDHAGEARSAFAVSTLPDTYLLDRRGRTVARFHGPKDWSHDDMSAAFAPLLIEASASPD